MIIVVGCQIAIKLPAKPAIQWRCTRTTGSRSTGGVMNSYRSSSAGWSASRCAADREKETRLRAPTLRAVRCAPPPPPALTTPPGRRLRRVFSNVLLSLATNTTQHQRALSPHINKQGGRREPPHRARLCAAARVPPQLRRPQPFRRRRVLRRVGWGRGATGRERVTGCKLQSSCRMASC